MAKKKRRTYEMSEIDTDAKVGGLQIADFGNLYKISGMLVQGMGESRIFLLPTANDIHFGVPMEELVASLTLEEFSEILRRTDDPLVFEEDDSGVTKIIHRKVFYAISGAVQQRIWVRDGLQCLYCGRKIGEIQLTVDHFMPLELGGDNFEHNYISSCRKDNKKKGNMHPMDWCAQEGLNFPEFQHYLRGMVELPLSHLS